MLTWVGEVLLCILLPPGGCGGCFAPHGRRTWLCRHWVEVLVVGALRGGEIGPPLVMEPSTFVGRWYSGGQRRKKELEETKRWGVMTNNYMRYRNQTCNVREMVSPLMWTNENYQWWTMNECDGINFKLKAPVIKAQIASKTIPFYANIYNST